MRRKNHRKPMIDQHRMWQTESIVGLIWEPVMSTNIMAWMATLQMEMRRMIHLKPIMHQPRMWRTEGRVLVSVKIRQYISDL